MPGLIPVFRNSARALRPVPPQAKSLSRVGIWAVCLVALACLFLAGSEPSRAQGSVSPRPAVLTVVSDDNYPPYIFRGDTGELQGILVDQWRAWEQATGIQVRLQAMDWGKAQEQMRQGGADVIDTIFETEARHAVYEFSKPYARIDVPVYVHKSLGGISDIKGLRGFTVGVKAGDAVVDEFKRYGIHSLKEYGSYKAIIDAAAQGEILVFSVDGPPAVYHLYKGGLEAEFRQAFVLYSGEFHRAVRKGETAMLRLVEEGFAAIPAATLKEIDERWLGAPLANPKRLRELLLGLAGLGVLFLALAAFSITLRRRVKARTAELDATVAALAESEERFRTIFNSVSDLLFIHSWPEGRIVDVNERTCEAFGYSREEMLRLQVQDTSCGEEPYDQDHAMALMRRAYEGEPQLAEWRAKRRDGSLFWLEVSIRKALILGEDSLLVSCRDISGRKAAEAALLASERRFSELIRYSSDSITILDREGTQIFVSDVVEKMLGYKPSELLGIQVIKELIHPDDQEAVLAALAAIIREGVGGAQYRHRRKDGSWVYLEAWGTNQLENPDIRGVVLNVRDITERMQAEAALSASEARYRSLFENAVEGIFQTGLDGKILAVNPALARLYGFENPQQFIDELKTTAPLYLDPQDRKRWLAEILEKGQVEDFEVRLRRRDGVQVWSSSSARLVRDAAGTPLSISGTVLDITERKQAAKLLADKEALLQAMLRNLPFDFWARDPEERIILQSEESMRLWGVLSGDVDDEAEISPQYRAQWREANRRAMAGEVVASEVTYATQADGQRTYHALVAPIQDGEQVLGIMGINIDVTERKSLEARLTESELHFRTLANTGQALIWTSGLDKLCNYFNEPWLAFTGRTLEQEMGNGWAEGVHPEDFDRCLEVYVTAFDRRESFSMEYRLRHHSGEHRWILDQGTPRYDGAGEFLGYIGHCMDIHEKRQAEAAQREQRRMLQTILNSLPQSVFWKDRRSVYLGCNAAFARDAGLDDPQDVLGRTDFDLPWLPEEAEAYRADDEQVMASGQSKLGYEEPLKRSDGASIWLETSKLPFLNEAGEAVGVIGIYEDITLRKRDAEQLRQSRKVADDANRAKSEFLANMSHEIRTPLNGVLGMIELLKSSGLAPEQQDYVGKAHEAARRLLALLNDILDFSKIEAGRMVLGRNVFALGEVFETVANVLGGQAAKKDLELTLRLDPSLPPALVGDDARLRQVLLNLVGNALKFTSQGGVHVEAWRVPRGGDQNLARLCLLVRDTGVGIPQDKLCYIFERFTQTDSSYARQYEGAGLGLAIVKRIMDLMGGTITVDSEEGRGTSIYLTLDLDVAAGDGKPLQRAEAAPQRVAPQRAAALRILLADDEPIGQLAMRVQLERLGHSVVIVANGREAIEALEAQDFDCVLMDIQMPEMDGVEATRRIRSSTTLGDKARVPIIALTAYALEGDREKFLAAGMDGHVGKPVQAEALVGLLAVLARRKG